jgi:hypothetical protein
LQLQPNCSTTAMGIMPHSDIDRALELSFSLDIPFWPQLPKVSFYEDMYVQVSENFPGIVLDVEGERIGFDNARFEEGMVDYSPKMGESETFALSRGYSVVYHRFLGRELESYPAVRGQLTGPVSFGFKVVDENNKPIIYSDGVRPLLFDFIQRKANVQYRALKERNSNAFVWLDEPGLGWVFSGLSGYNDVQAKADYGDFLEGLEGPKALHLCANVNLPYLLSMGVELLSFDAYQMELMPKGYAGDVAGFIDGGGIICWGIVPTDSASLDGEMPQTLAGRLSGYWRVVADNIGISAKRIAEQALLAPARCCLKNIGGVGAADSPAGQGVESCQISGVEEGLVERAFAYLRELSRMLRDEYSL